MTEKHDEDTTMLSRSHATATAAHEDSRAHFLYVAQGDSKGRRIPIGREPFTIGRSEPADVVIPDAQISRKHCRISLTLGAVLVTDLGSSNGVFIDGNRISGDAKLSVGSRLLLGSHVLEHEWRDPRTVAESQELDRDIEQAWRYIQALLPPPLQQGPIRSDWVLVPCVRLGGDAFGYRFLDSRHFAIYLIDVSGHGTGAAMHAVSVINVLRQNMFPQADYLDPTKVLTRLNDMFRMETHGNLYFTVWYGVFDLETREIAYACAGHHAAYIVPPARDRAIALYTRNPVIGVLRDVHFTSQSAKVPADSKLYVFSDGVFEITTSEGKIWELDDFVPLILLPAAAGVRESEGLLEAVRDAARDPALDDDFSLLVIEMEGSITSQGTETPLVCL